MGHTQSDTEPMPTHLQAAFLPKLLKDKARGRTYTLRAAGFGLLSRGAEGPRKAAGRKRCLGRVVKDRPIKQAVRLSWEGHAGRVEADTGPPICKGTSVSGLPPGQRLPCGGSLVQPPRPTCHRSLLSAVPTPGPELSLAHPAGEAW